MTRLFLAAVSTLSLLAGGCATQRIGIDNAYAQQKLCSKEVVAQPGFAALASHTYFGIPASELADERLPTPEEARLAVARWDAVAPCRQALLAALAGPPANRADAAQIISAAHAQGGLIFARFAKGNMTWGQLAEARQAIDVAARAQLGVADAEASREATNRALATAAIIGAITPRPPQTIYVRPCTFYSQLALAC